MLANFTGFAAFMQSELSAFEKTTLPTSAFTSSLPVIGETLKSKAASNLLLKDAITGVGTANDNTTDRNTMRENIQTALDATGLTNVVVTDNMNDSFRLQFGHSESLNVSGFNSGIKPLPISGSAFNVEFDYTVDLTFGIDGNGFFFNGAASAKEFQINVSIANSSLPALQMQLGSFSATATPKNVADKALDASFAINVTGDLLRAGASIPATTAIAGTADVDLRLSLEYPVGGLTPKLMSDFNLTYGLAAGAVAPTITFANVELDLGNLLKGFGGKAVENVLEKAKPVFQLAEKFQAPLPGLDELSKQIQDLVGDLKKVKTGVEPLDLILKAFAEPNLLNVLDAGAEFLKIKNPGQATKVQDFVKAVKVINQVNDLVAGFKGQEMLVLSFGTFTLGTTVDLRTATGQLQALSPATVAPGTAVDAQGGVAKLKKFLKENHLETDLLSPASVFQLLAGSENVRIVEYVNDLPAISLADVKITNQNFAIGIIPANFQINAELKLDPNIRFGFDSRGLVTKSPVKGLYVGAGTVPAGSTNVGDFSFVELVGEVNIELAVGQDYEIASVRAGVRGAIVATASAYFAEIPAKSGKLHVDQFSTDCPMQGAIEVKAVVSLFADARLNLDPGAILRSVKALVESAIKNNPTLLVAKRMLEAATPYLKNAGVSSADLDNLNKLVSNPKTALQGVANGLEKVGNHATDGFKKTADNIAKGKEKIRGFIKDPGGSIGNALGSAGNSIGFGLAGFAKSKELYSETLLFWPTGSCGATDTGGGLNPGDLIPFPNAVPPILGSVKDGILTLYVGPAAANRNVEKTTINESVLIRPADSSAPNNGKVVVSMFGASQSFGGVKHIFADAGDGNNSIDARTVGATVQFVGGTGTDTFFAGLRSATFIGGAGRNTLTGSPQNDNLFGGVDRDIVYGLAGNDSIYGGEGDDVLIGDFEKGTIEDNSTDAALSGNDVIVAGPGSDYVYGGRGDDNLDGGLGDDVLDGGFGQDTIHGSGGNDEIEGGDGDDLLFSGVGNSRIRGGLGNDRIHAGDGINVLEGGEGKDVIVGGGRMTTSTILKTMAKTSLMVPAVRTRCCLNHTPTQLQ